PMTRHDDYFRLNGSELHQLALGGCIDISREQQTPAGAPDAQDAGRRSTGYAGRGMRMEHLEYDRIDLPRITCCTAPCPWEVGVRMAADQDLPVGELRDQRRDARGAGSRRPAHHEPVDAADPLTAQIGDQRCIDDTTGAAVRL